MYSHWIASRAKRFRSRKLSALAMTREEGIAFQVSSLRAPIAFRSLRRPLGLRHCERRAQAFRVFVIASADSLYEHERVAREAIQFDAFRPQNYFHIFSKVFLGTSDIIIR
jgi:hypothetical protein